jgi:hypothetical protein
VNAATEGFKRVISRFERINDTAKSTLYYLFALLAGLGVAFATNAAPQLFERTLLSEYPVVANVLLGLALGYGSKATYFLMDLIANLREFSQTYTTTIVTVESTVPPVADEAANVETVG